jgi:hypothetical protein
MLEGKNSKYIYGENFIVADMNILHTLKHFSYI